MTILNAALSRAGEIIGGLAVAVIGIALLFGPPLAGIGIAGYIGVWLAFEVGGGHAGVVAFFGGGFAVLLFLSVYVCTPVVWPAVQRASDALLPNGWGGGR